MTVRLTHIVLYALALAYASRGAGSEPLSRPVERTPSLLPTRAEAPFLLGLAGAPA